MHHLEQLALLAEHRQALITAAVAGELRVPGVLVTPKFDELRPAIETFRVFEIRERTDRERAARWFVQHAVGSDRDCCAG